MEPKNTAIEADRKRITALEAARFAYASEFPPNEDGDPDVGSIHENIRKLKAELEADRKRRGEPVAYVPLVSGSGKPEWSGTLPIGHELYEMHKDKCPWKPLYTAPQPAEPVKVPADTSKSTPEIDTSSQRVDAPGEWQDFPKE